MTPTPNHPGAWEALVQSDPVAANAVLAELRRTIFVPHEGGQAEVMASEARFRILRAGRRWGKTRLAAHETVMAATSKPGQMVWWVANNERNVMRGYRNVLRQLPRELLVKDPPSEKANVRVLELKNGSRIEFYTAGTPDALIGEGVDFLVVDEAAAIEESVWYQRLRPTLSDTGGRALIISTPRGRNWFYKLWQRGQRPGTGYASWHFTSYDNPYIENEEIDDARDTLPSIVFQQEYLAEFVQNAASIFSWSDAQVVPLAMPEGHVVMGVDLAKKEDFTVLDAANAETRLPVMYERLNTTSWPDQEALIVERVEELEEDPHVDGVTVLIDSTGVGDVVYDHLDDKGLDVLPISFGSGTGTRQKERMVRLLAADLEHGRAFLHPEQTDEFETYEYEISPSGNWKFAAAGGGHDDKVSAKMLQHWGIVHEAPPDVKVLELNPREAEAELEAEEREPELISPDSPSEIMLRPDAWN